jgi:hypothetical protein
MTRGRLIAHTAAKLGFETTADSEELLLMQEWAQKGVVDVLLRTHCYVEVGDMLLTAGVSEYRLDADILAVLNDRITSSGDKRHFDVVTLAEIIDYQNANAAYVSSTSGATKVAFEGNLMVTYPAAATADTIRFFYVPRPTDMTEDSHDPSVAAYGGIPTEYHDAILYYMLWQGAEYDDKRAALGPGDYFSIYDGLCKEYRQMHRKKASRGIRPARVGYPANRNLGRRNDVYP